MKARRTHRTDIVFKLPGGTEDNDLWVERMEIEDEVLGVTVALGSTWVPSDEERRAIADGANIELLVVGTVLPPLAMHTATVPLGKAPEVVDGG